MHIGLYIVFHMPHNGCFKLLSVAVSINQKMGTPKKAPLHAHHPTHCFRWNPRLLARISDVKVEVRKPCFGQN